MYAMSGEDVILMGANEDSPILNVEAVVQAKWRLSLEGFTLSIVGLMFIKLFFCFDRSTKPSGLDTALTISPDSDKKHTVNAKGPEVLAHGVVSMRCCIALSGPGSAGVHKVQTCRNT